MGRRPEITAAKLEKMSPPGKIAFAIFFIIGGIIAIIVVSNFNTSELGEIFGLIYLLIILNMLFSLYLLISGISALIAEKEYEKNLSKSNIIEIDRMQGYEFEVFLKTLFIKLGYSAEVTKKSGDFGADLILDKNETKIVVQSKRYDNHVGVKAVQEIYSSMSYYCANEAWVVTNNYFTRQAKELANNNGVRLIDREELVKLIAKTK